MLVAGIVSLSPPSPNWFFAFVIGGFGVAMVRQWRKTSREQFVREAASTEPVSFRTGVRLKLRLTGGIWSPKTLGAMELIIGTSTVRLTTRPEIAGRVLGSEWFFTGKDTTIKWSMLRSDPFRRTWIIISGTSAGQKAQVAVVPMEYPDHVWEGLLRVGCLPL
jgi:hypothetical protein